MYRWLALVFMTLDHIAYYFSPYLTENLYLFGRGIGRLAFPMFCYALVCGQGRTRSLSRYFTRLLTVAILGQLSMEVTAKLTGLWTFTNVLFTLSYGLLLISGLRLMEQAQRDREMRMKLMTTASDGTSQVPFPVNPSLYSMHPLLGYVLGFGAVVLAILATAKQNPDYSFIGLSQIVILYLFHSRQGGRFQPSAGKIKIRGLLLPSICITLINLLPNLPILIQSHQLTTLSLWLPALSGLAVFLFPYEACGKAPGKVERAFHYVYYPLHLCLIMLFRTMVK